MITSLIYQIELIIRKVRIRVLALGVKRYLILHGCKVGRRFKCTVLPRFITLPNRNIVLGDNVTFGGKVSLDIDCNGKLRIGSDVLITNNVTFAAAEEISIGDHILIAENVSIRDSDHGLEKSEYIKKQPGKADRIHIGNDVWIGTGAVVLKGSMISDGAVIAAHSVVVKKSPILPYCIYGGVPVKFLRARS